MTDRVHPQLYLVSPPRFEPAGFAESVARALDAGPVACLQLWMPDASQDEIRIAGDLLAKVVRDRDTAFVLNGPVKLATYLGCDGVHLDQPTKKDVKAALSALGADGIVGASAGTSRHVAMDAAEAGASYISFGPCFDTPTKDLPGAPEALDALNWWSELMEVPCVAVGGITPDLVPRVMETRCEFICAVSAVWDHPDGPAAAVAAFQAAFDGASLTPS